MRDVLVGSSASVCDHGGWLACGLKGFCRLNAWRGGRANASRLVDDRVGAACTSHGGCETGLEKYECAVVGRFARVTLIAAP